MTKVKIGIGGVSLRPLESEDIKTGDWGTSFPVVDNEKCKGCNDCEISCPDAAIEVIKEGKKQFRVEFDYDHCKGCGICAFVCKEDAITMNVKEIYKV